MFHTPVTVPSVSYPSHRPQCSTPQSPSPVFHTPSHRPQCSTPLVTVPSVPHSSHGPQCFIPQSPSPVFHTPSHLPQCSTPQSPSPVFHIPVTVPSVPHPSHGPQCSTPQSASPLFHIIVTVPNVPNPSHRTFLYHGISVSELIKFHHSTSQKFHSYSVTASFRVCPQSFPIPIWIARRHCKKKGVSFFLDLIHEELAFRYPSGL